MRIADRVAGIVLLFLVQLPYCTVLYSQDTDSAGYLPAKELDEVVVTAARRSESLSRIAYNTTVLGRKELSLFPAHSFDDIFSMVAGINQDRKNGIFSGSQNTMNMMGTTGGQQGRVLVLEDGIPLNVSDNGEVNWNRFDLADFSQIEIIKGPASSLYGSNAMGGIINLVSRIPQKPFELNTRLSYGSYNTAMARVDLSGKPGRFYWKAGLNYNRSDGYIMPPDSLRDSTDAPTFLYETGIRLKTGYMISKFLKLEASYCFYDDRHGYGLKIFDDQGGYSSHRTHFSRLGLQYDNYKWFFNLNFFYQQENYAKLIEKLKGTAYSALDVRSERGDGGMLAFLGKKTDHYVISAGADLRTGSTTGIDDYRTSTDIVNNRGRIVQLSSYVHVETNLTGNKLKMAGSLNYTMVSLQDAAFSIENPTDETSYMANFAQAFSDTLWSAFNPSVSLKYSPFKNLSFLGIYSHGFRAPTIDDLTRSGMMSIGFKEASPLLRPEKINHYQLTVNARIFHSLFIAGAAWYSSGIDYIYYIDTGETLFNGKRKVYRKDNINQIEAIGADLTLKWNPYEWIQAYANLSLNRSVIHKNEILEGKRLSYTPGHMEGLGIITDNKYVGGSVNWVYRGEQYMDDLNESPIPAHGIISLTINKTLATHFKVSVTLQNLSDKQYLFDGRNLTLGRFISAGFELMF